MTKSIPNFIYGTAWKEERTARHVADALKAGFTAIDTANQRKHYFEEGTGNGIAEFLKESNKKRDDFFIQTKFTFARGQDHRKPYNESDSFTQQVHDSFASSLQHLQTSYLDSYVLHGPYTGDGLHPADFETWRAMEDLQKQGKVMHLGISNVHPDQLSLLCQSAEIKPTFVQNRCYARLGWDHHVRRICKSEGIYYQGFSLLTANQRELSVEPIFALATKYRKTVPQIVFRFCQQIKMIPLTGTCDPNHMTEDLDIYDFELSDLEINLIETIAL